jgi:hypothetical protein
MFFFKIKNKIENENACINKQIKTLMSANFLFSKNTRSRLVHFIDRLMVKSTISLIYYNTLFFLFLFCKICNINYMIDIVLWTLG